ncbi:MAG: adenylate/guanylate cyclase domain-containing protein [Hyphomonadaceae bacterium]
MSEPVRKLAAIVSIDVAGYSALTEKDQEAAARAIAQFREHARAVCAVNGGRIFSTAGDGAMLEFNTASDALAAAIALCEDVRDLKLRFGVHLGEVIVAEDGDLLGHGVNVAARLQAAADPGGILVSQLARDTAGGDLAQRFTARGKLKLPKMRETMTVFAFAAAHQKPRTEIAKTPVLAVLAFDNLSRDKDTRFFSDGVSEEILYTVSRVRGLKVIGSTSSFAFRGREKKNAAKTLGATHVLDGSVRREGENVRIAAQLMEAEGGTVLWSERYDRAVDDAFALQEEIGAEVAAALTLVLDAARQERAKKVTADVFDRYLKAREHLRSGAPERIAESADMLADIVRETPDFARGWSALAMARLEVMRMARADRIRMRDDARDAAMHAIGLDPGIGEGYAILAALESEFSGWREREKWLTRALAAEPSNAFILLSHGQFLISVGRVKEGYAQQARAYELDPLDPMIAAFHGHNVWATVSKEDGRRIMEEAAQRNPRNIFLWYMRLNTARIDMDFATADALAEQGIEMLPALKDTAVFKAGEKLQEVLSNPSEDAFLKLGEDFAMLAEQQPSAALDLAVALAVLGFVGPALQIFEEALDDVDAWRANSNDALRPHVGHETALLFVQATIALRLNPGFVRLCSRLGLISYWRETQNWPDCVEDVAPMYDFRAEAGKHL